jgi:VanZ family protein
MSLSQVVVEPLTSLPRRDWKQWIPALIWVGIICIESTDLLSSEHTGSILYAVLTRVFGPINILEFIRWHHDLRKLGHVVGYAVLSYLLFRAWRATLLSASGHLWSLSWARLSFWMTVAIASADELHQSYIPSRTGRWQDVVLDSAAALGIQILLYAFLRNKTRKPAAN